MIEVEVRGTYLRRDGDPATGTIVFAPRSLGASATDNAIFPRVPVHVALDNQGSFAVDLQATDDPDSDPSGWTYRVEERIIGIGPRRVYDIDVPASAAGQGLELADVAPVDPAIGEATAFVTLAAFNDLEDRVEVVETDAGATAAAFTAHAADTTGVHGIADTSLLETQAGASAKADAAKVTARLATLAAGAFGPIDAALDAGGAAAIQIQGDSTGNATDEWVYMLGQWIAARHPLAHVKYALWSDANQGYDPWAVLQAGAGEVHAPFVTASTRTMSMAQAEVPHIGGDIDIRVRASLTDWTPASTMTLVSRYGSAGARAWRLAVNTSGGIDFLWTTDGTTNIQKVTGTPLGFTDGSEGWVRVTLDVDNGGGGYSWRGYKSTDGTTWTEIGSSVTATGGATSIFNATQEYEIGGRGSTGELLTGKIYEVQIRDGINGKIVNPQPITAWMPRIASGSFVAGTFGGGATLYVLNGSHPGAAASYLADTTRHPLMVRPFPGCLNFQSCSHNDGSSFRGAYVTTRDAWLALTEARAPGSQTVILTQNPEVSPIESPLIHAHAERRRLLKMWAARRGLALVDTWQAFVDHVGGAATLIAADGVHPTPSVGDGTRGEDVWLKAITDAWVASAA